MLGKPYQHYDEAGLLAFETYDFKANVLEKTRKVISDARILSVFEPATANNWQVQAFRVGWQPASGITLENHASGLLDPIEYRTSITYDGLNRIKTMRYPQDVDGERKELRPQYNRASALERVELDGTTFVDHIAYNAKGQRVAYRLWQWRDDSLRLRSADVSSDATAHRVVHQADPLTYHPTGTPLQDFAYDYDLVGNITTIRDRPPKAGSQTPR